MNFYVRLFLVILVVLAVAQVAAEFVNTFLLLVLAGMFILNANQFAKLLKQLKLS